MEGVVLLDNSAGTEIYGDGTFSFDYLVDAGSHNVGWDYLFIRECKCWKRDHTYTGAVH
jgi:hypothetical protein